ncbi:DUF3034 domain-containing protein [Kineobactrum sediminis]|uniref:DUF3034 domain-containing protein n=1 Tax=Kineobactrum sediminis TaxID=1905677 RepID=A0A2N5Y231_9GAMM|nr:DUF3034 family protein [Kineobactrum sediminis]PLW82464.1 DUF3034 domain-containing protein [Kineobactrum sediminis]
MSFPYNQGHWLCVLALLAAQVVHADSKLLATGGASGIEGQAGGGIVPWAVISGYGDFGEWGGATALTRVNLPDFQLDVSSFSIAFDNRFEFSASRQELEVKPLGLTINQQVLAVKVRLGGDLIYTSLPQLSLGMQHKRNRDMAVPMALGTDKDSSTDVYLAGSKLWLNGLMGRNVFANLTLRLTEAHQAGLLGFADGYQLQAEASTGIFLNRHWIVGAEYRQKPDRLASVNEDDWLDVFVGWFPSKRFSLVLAWSDLGDIAGLADQDGLYLSLQLSQ